MKDLKVLLFNGSPNEFGCTYTALEEVAGELQKQGIETEIFWCTCSMLVFKKIGGRRKSNFTNKRTITSRSNC